MNVSASNLKVETSGGASGTKLASLIWLASLWIAPLDVRMRFAVK